MKSVKSTMFGILTVSLLLAGLAPFAGAAAAKTPAELEKEKAMAEPYANDFGPEKIDVSKYPAKVQEGYKILQKKCSVCHAPSRPLNSQFVETGGKSMADREAALKALKKSDPELFKNEDVWQIEAGIWQRYVKRMMNKPGCDISKADGKKIWEFIAYDSQQRKIGKNKAAWEKHRKGLLEEFKKKHPERYKKLYGQKHKD